MTYRIRAGIAVAGLVVTCAASSQAQIIQEQQQQVQGGHQQQQQQQQPQPYYAPPPQQPVAYNGPPEMKYREGDPIPPGYHVDSKPRKGLIIAGAIVTGVPWALGLPTATSSKVSADRWLYAPVIGPWGDLAARPKCEELGTTTGNLNCTAEWLYRFLLVFDGIVQTAGGILFTVGIAVEKTVLVRNDMAYVKPAPLTMKVLPSRLGPNAYGLAAFGEF